MRPSSNPNTHIQWEPTEVNNNKWSHTSNNTWSCLKASIKNNTLVLKSLEWTNYNSTNNSTSSIKAILEWITINKPNPKTQWTLRLQNSLLDPEGFADYKYAATVADMGLGQNLICALSLPYKISKKPAQENCTNNFQLA